MYSQKECDIENLVQQIMYFQQKEMLAVSAHQAA